LVSSSSRRGARARPRLGRRHTARATGRPLRNNVRCV